MMHCVCSACSQVLISLLIAATLLALTYKLCPSALNFPMKWLPGGGGGAAAAGGAATDAEKAPLMEDFDETESMAM